VAGDRWLTPVARQVQPPCVRRRVANQLRASAPTITSRDTQQKARSTVDADSSTPPLPFSLGSKFGAGIFSCYCICILPGKSCIWPAAAFDETVLFLVCHVKLFFSGGTKRRLPNLTD
jgi:hypothetical protein